MQYRALGQTGISLSVLGLGLANLGLHNRSLRDTREVIEGALELGVNYVDTAECYGTSEHSVGLIKSSILREFHVFTKVGHGDESIGPDWDFHSMEQSVDRSLVRLGIEQIDLLQSHSCPKNLLEDGSIFDFLSLMKRKGKARFIGCSADGHAAEFAVTNFDIDVIQCSLNLVDQQNLYGVVRLAETKGIGLLTKRSIFNAVWAFKDRPSNPWLHDYWERFRELDVSPLDYGCDSYLELSLRFSLGLKGVSSILIGTEKSEHLKVNYNILKKGPLSNEMMDQILCKWSSLGADRWLAKG